MLMMEFAKMLKLTPLIREKTYLFIVDWKRLQTFCVKHKNEFMILKIRLQKKECYVVTIE